MKQVQKLLPFLFAFFAIIFFVLRVPSIVNETVPYTYDQGRDFAAAKKIIAEKDLTLIGPTTGSEGVFHGAWWYYYLAIPYLVTSGAPQGFYAFITIVAFAQTALFAYFLKKEGYSLLGLAFFAVVAVSPYFIRTSIFAINSIMALPAILLFMYTLHRYFKKDTLWNTALVGLSAGLIIEGELAFGIFFVPSFILTLLLTKNVKYFFGSVKKVGYFFAALALAVSTRIVFELKNNFLQTKNLLAFTDVPGTEPKTWKGLLQSRTSLFREYFGGIFDDRIELISWLILAIALVYLFKGFKKFKKIEQKYISFLGVLTVLLFITSLIYKDSAFWPYYFEGIQFLFIVLMLFGLLAFCRVQKKYGIYFLYLLIAISLVAGGLRTYDILYAQEPKPEGLRMHTVAVNYLVEKTAGEESCLRIYTPPVIPHTYNYLLDYATHTKNFIYPHTEYTNNECWYFIEADGNEKRRADWINSNVPEGAELVEENVVSDNLIIRKYYLDPVLVE